MTFPHTSAKLTATWKKLSQTMFSTFISDRRSAVVRKVCAPESSADLASNSSSVCFRRSCITRVCQACASAASCEEISISATLRSALQSNRPCAYTSPSGYLSPLSTFVCPLLVNHSSKVPYLRNRLTSSTLAVSLLFLLGSLCGLGVEACRFCDIADNLISLSRYAGVGGVVLW